MTGPDDRPEPSSTADEVTTLLEFLEFHRATLRWKTDGLDAEGLRRTLAPSSMTLGGLLKHLAFVEGYWLLEVMLGQAPAPPFDAAPWKARPDWEWETAADDGPDDLRALHEDAVARSRLVTAELLAADGLETRSRRPGAPFTLRWVLVHLIEEYARHNGHADLLRESIDGMTGE